MKSSSNDNATRRHGATAETFVTAAAAAGSFDVNPADHHRTAGSSTVNDDSELDEHEWERWRRTKELVEKEEGQAEWRKIQAVAKNYDDKSVDRFTRGISDHGGFHQCSLSAVQESASGD